MPRSSATSSDPQLLGSQCTSMCDEYTWRVTFLGQKLEEQMKHRGLQDVCSCSTEDHLHRAFLYFLFLAYSSPLQAVNTLVIDSQGELYSKALAAITTSVGRKTPTFCFLLHVRFCQPTRKWTSLTPSFWHQNDRV